jgi:hypothetical protein
MNMNFLAVVRRIIAEQGESILAEPQRLKSFVSDYAINEPKSERLAFGRCIEYGFYGGLKKTPSPDERVRSKAAFAQRLHNEQGMDAALCAGALDLLEAAIWGYTAPVMPVQPKVPENNEGLPAAGKVQSFAPYRTNSPASIPPPQTAPAAPHPWSAPPQKKSSKIPLIAGIAAALVVFAVLLINMANQTPQEQPGHYNTGGSSNQADIGVFVAYNGTLVEKGKEYPVRMELIFKDNALSRGFLDYTGNDAGPMDLTGEFSDQWLVLYEMENGRKAAMWFETENIGNDSLTGTWQDLYNTDRVLNIILTRDYSGSRFSSQSLRQL